MDGVGGMTRKTRNIRTGLALFGLVISLVIYSLIVIQTRGKLPEPANLTPLQRILRGL
jgi:hypothetical protein